MTRKITSEFALIISLLGFTLSAQAASLSGSVTNETAAGLSNVRVTLFNNDTSAFWEVRSSVSGAFNFDNVPPGAYRLGASFPNREYKEMAATVPASSSIALALGPETEKGRWDILLDAAPDRLGGTNSAVLLPDGRVMYCHNTLDPFIFNPVNNQITRPPASPRQQGCHAVTVLPNGLVIYVGGHDMGVYGPGTKQVKTYDPVASKWVVRPDLTGARWYPSMVPLSDGSLLAIGGGNENNPVRSKTSEIMDPLTMKWTQVGDIAIGNEVSPIVQLYTGEVLMTHRPPQLYNPSSKTWRKAGDFVQGNRMANGDHADHDMVLMPDGKAVAIGFYSFTPGQPGNQVEIYDPALDSWKLGANFAPVRSRPNLTLLPGKKILVMGGYKQEKSAPGDTNAWGQLKLSDLYEPGTDSWRRLADLNVAREYHATPVLVPDGRVIIVGGEGEPGNEPAKSTLEAFTPPYMLHGVRPEIKPMAKSEFGRGEIIDFDIQKTMAPTSVILMSTSANTHFMDSGNNRYLELGFTMTGNSVHAQVPADAIKMPYGFYMLFVMVDDIPSQARMIKIGETVTSAFSSSKKISVRSERNKTGKILSHGKFIFTPTENKSKSLRFNFLGISYPLLP